MFNNKNNGFEVYKSGTIINNAKACGSGFLRNVRPRGNNKI